MQLDPETERRCMALAVKVNGVPVQLRSVTPVIIDPKDEGEFQAKVDALFKERGWLSYHTRDSRRSEEGFLDCIGIRGPRLVVAELKMPGKRMSVAQLDWYASWASIPGAERYLWYPANWNEIVEVLK